MNRGRKDFFLNYGTSSGWKTKNKVEAGKAWENFYYLCTELGGIFKGKSRRGESDKFNC